ncbi:MAG: hypothetical protein ACPGTP_00450, partial [Bacteroidia bacterium]
MKSKYWLILLSTALVSCSKSLVYSPSLNLTTTPINKSDIDIQGSLEMLPETRPEELGGTPTTFGFNGQISYGFSDRFNLTAKGWSDLQNRENQNRTGFALNGQFLKDLSANNKLIVMPRIGIALSGNEVAGYGLGSSLIYQNIVNDKFSWYGGAGAVWGFRYLEKDLNHKNESKLPMGIGAIGNLGLSWQCSYDFRINMEINPTYQINTFDENSQFM